MTRSRDVADTQDNLGGAVAPFVGGKNAIINGGFDWWQRGTSFSSNGYTADRWSCNFSGATGTVSQQTFTPGTAPVAGYEGQFFLRLATTVANDNSRVEQKMENVRTFAGQTVTVSFYAKADSTRTITLEPYQNFGSGGSADVVVTSQTISVTTAWTRFTKTFAIPSVAGKTIGTSSFFSLEIKNAAFETFTLDLWGVQVEAGSVATPFQTASGSIGGELALCQRYYYRAIAGTFNINFGMGQCFSTTGAYAVVPFPVIMRTQPSALEQNGTAGDYRVITSNFGATNCTSIVTFNSASTWQSTVVATVGSGLVAGNATAIASTNGGAYLGWSAEL
jgi:hypothetical protein